MRNVLKLNEAQKKLLTEISVERIGDVSAEELNGGGQEEVSPETLLSEKEMKSISGVLQDITNAKDQKQLALIASKVKAGKKAGKYNDEQVKVLKEAYINKLKKLSFDK